LLRQAVGNLQKMRAAGPLRDPVQSAFAVGVALVAEEYTLARLLLDDWDRQVPAGLVAVLLRGQMDRMRLTLRARTELKAGAYGPAVEAAEKVLKQSPNDPVAKKIHQDALKKLREEYRRRTPDAPDKRVP
jgi:hypothetical protein